MFVAELCYPPGVGFAPALSLLVLIATLGLACLGALVLGAFAWRRFQPRWPHTGE